MNDPSATRQLQSTVAELSKTVADLSANVQTQTATFEGFQKLFELHIKTIQSDTHTLKNAIKVQDADIDRLKSETIERLKNEVSELRHGMKGLQTYPKTLSTVVKRIQSLEDHNLKLRGQVQGATFAARWIWVIGGIAFSAASSFFTWLVARG